MRRFANILIVMTAASAGLLAQQAPPLPAAPATAAPVQLQGVIRNFEFPERDEKGALRYVIKGDEARPVGNNRWELTGLVATVYGPDGKVESIFRTAKCFFDQNTKELETGEEILFERDNMVVKGRGMKGTLTKEGEGVEIQADVSVRIFNLQKGAVEESGGAEL